MIGNPLQPIDDTLREILFEIRQLKSKQLGISTSNDDELMDVEAASKYLKISRHTIFSKTASNSIPFIRLGKRSIRFRKSDLLAWAQTNNLKSR